MSEFFLELFSEEIPSKLQVNSRKILQENLKKFFEENQILIKGKLNVFSTPNRLVVNIDKITKQISRKPEEIRGPNIKSPAKALEGFLRSNNIKKNQIFKKKNEKGEFYFYKKPSQKINTADLLKKKPLYDQSKSVITFSDYKSKPNKEKAALKAKSKKKGQTR